jgi:hypothetical protein
VHGSEDVIQPHSDGEALVGLAHDPVIDYTLQVTIHRRWLRLVAKPLIGGFSMEYWERAVIQELRRWLET